VKKYSKLSDSNAGPSQKTLGKQKANRSEEEVADTIGDHDTEDNGDEEV